MRVLDKALLKTGRIDDNEYAARELYRELSHGEMGDGYSPAMKVLAGLGIGAFGSVAAPAIVQTVDNAYAGEAQAAEKAEAAEAHATEAHAYANKKIRILVKPFEVTGEGTIKRYLGTKTYSGDDDGLAVKYAIETELESLQNEGRFNRVFEFVEDTDKPDELEADLVVKGVLHRSGNRLQFFTKVVDMRKGKSIYTDRLELRKRPGNVTSGGFHIAGGLDNYLDNNIDELLE